MAQATDNQKQAGSMEPLHQAGTGLGRFSPRALSAWLAIALAVLTFMVYWPVVHHEFIYFDDGFYLVQSSHVNTGLSGETSFGRFKPAGVATGIR